MADAVPGTIEIQVEEIAQLFNMLDPFPFRERDLDKDAEEFIVGWARELPRNVPIRILIHVSKQEAESGAARELGGAFARYFNYRADIIGRDLKELFRVGRRSVMIGIAVLAACVFAGRVLLQAMGSTEISGFLSEGLLLLGWVANWRPLEIFLYDWWPIARRRDLYRRLAAAQVELSPR